MTQKLCSNFIFFLIASEKTLPGVSTPIVNLSSWCDLQQGIAFYLIDFISEVSTQGQPAFVMQMINASSNHSFNLFTNMEISNLVHW